MRIVHLVTALNPGGLERVVIDLVHHQIKAGYAVLVLCLESPGQLAAELQRHDVEVRGLQPPGTGLFARVRALARELRRFRADVIHSHNPGPHLHAVAAARLAGLRAVVHTKHGRNYPEDRVRILINRWASRLSSAIVAVSHDAAEVARQIERVPDSRLHVIPNGVDLQPFQHGDGSTSASRAVHVARLHPVKDQVTLLHAVARVAAAWPSFVLDIVGDGPERARLEQLGSDLEIERHVRFAGYQRDVRPYLNGAAFFVLSSITEGLSMTIVEAMAAGLPVIATRVGGNPEAVEDGCTGLLVGHRDPEALAAAMLMLLNQPERRREMGRAGRERVVRHFDLRDTVARYDTVYRAVLTSTRAVLTAASPAIRASHS